MNDSAKRSHRQHFATERLARVRRLPVVDYPDVVRPVTRGDCVDAPRPCPFVSCRMHLALDVSQDGRSIKFNFPGVELEDMPDTCALDVADREGGVVLDEVAKRINLTRQGANLIERNILEDESVRAWLSEFAPEGRMIGKARAGVGIGNVVATPAVTAPSEEPEEEGGPIRVARFIEAGTHDTEWCARVNRIYTERLIERGLVQREGKTMPNATEIVAGLLEGRGPRKMGRPLGEMTKKAGEVWSDLKASVTEPITGDMFASFLGCERQLARAAFERAKVAGLIPADAVLEARPKGPPKGTPPKNVSRTRPVAMRPPPMRAPAATSSGDPIADALHAELVRLDARKAKIEKMLEDLTS